VTHEFKTNVETMEELIPKAEVYLKQMEGLADGYKEERALETLRE
jgi:hypothetical protein